MSELTRYVPSVAVEKDLDEPQLGALIKDETVLGFGWGALSIAAFLYIPGLGIISALSLAYMGYRDIKALTAKPRSSKAIPHPGPVPPVIDERITEPSPWKAKPRQQPNLGITPALPPQTDFIDPEEEARVTGVPVAEVMQRGGYSDDMIRSMGYQIGAAVVDSVIVPPNTVFQDPRVEEEPKPFDIAAYLAANPQPLMITAAPRTGKGVIIAQMIREFKQRNPGSPVWVIQPKYHPKEWGYWSCADNVWGDMIENYLGNPKEIERINEEMMQFIFEWRALPPRPKLLVIDEGVKIGAVTPKWFRDFLVPTVKTEASSGETDDRYLVYVTQSALVQDIGMSSGDRGCLDVLCLARTDKKSHLKAFLGSFKGQVAEPDPRLYALSKSPTKAIVYSSSLDEWHPMPEYPVYQSEAPHPNNAAGSLKKPERPSLGAGYTEPNPWADDWDFDDGPTVIEYPEIQGKADQLKASEDPRRACAGEFLEALVKLGNGTIVSASDIGKTAWAQRWQGKGGGLTDRSADTLAPFIRNAVKFRFLAQKGDKYEVTLR